MSNVCLRCPPAHPPPPRRAARLADQRSRRVPPRGRGDAVAKRIQRRMACAPHQPGFCGVPALGAAYSGGRGFACLNIAYPCGPQASESGGSSGKFDPDPLLTFRTSLPSICQQLCFDIRSLNAFARSIQSHLRWKQTFIGWRFTQWKIPIDWPNGFPGNVLAVSKEVHDPRPRQSWKFGRRP